MYLPLPVHHPETFFEDVICAPMSSKFSTLSLVGENHGGAEDAPPDRMFPDCMVTKSSAKEQPPHQLNSAMYM
jgi:hypothetical protein